MTQREKRSLQYRLARRFALDPRRIMEIIREEIKKSPLTEEPPKGEWIDHRPKAIYIRYECTNCNEMQGMPTKYCPNCGAYMERLIKLPRGASE